MLWPSSDICIGIKWIPELPEDRGMSDLLPPEFNLGQNYPNPFSEITAIKFCVPYKTVVTLDVFDSGGGLAETLLDEVKEAGTYMVEFHAKDTAAGGIYVYRLNAGNFSTTKKMLLVKAQSHKRRAHP